MTFAPELAAQRVPDAFLFQMDACHIPFREEFDLIGAFDVLEHIEIDQGWVIIPVRRVIITGCKETQSKESENAPHRYRCASVQGRKLPG